MTKLAKQLFILVAFLATANVYATDFSVSQGVSFIKTDAISVSTEDNNSVIPCVNNKFASFTNFEVNSTYVDGSATVEASKEYVNCEASVTGEYNLGSITPFISSNFVYKNFGLQSYTNWNAERMYLDLYAGIEVSGSFSFVTVNFSGYFGYVALNTNTITNGLGANLIANNNNTTIAGLKVEVELSKYFEVYFAMDSYQVLYSEDGCFGFSPNAINNKFGFKAHYEFDNGLGVYLLHSYNCCHPEKPYEMSRSNYDTNRSDFTIGVKYTF